VVFGRVGTLMGLSRERPVVRETLPSSDISRFRVADDPPTGLVCLDAEAFVRAPIAALDELIVPQEVSSSGRASTAGVYFFGRDSGGIIPATR